MVKLRLLELAGVPDDNGDVVPAKAGTIVELDDQLAARFLRRGLAEAVEDVKKAAPAKKKKASKKKTDA